MTHYEITSNFDILPPPPPPLMRLMSEYANALMVRHSRLNSSDCLHPTVNSDEMGAFVMNHSPCTHYLKRHI